MTTKQLLKLALVIIVIVAIVGVLGTFWTPAPQPAISTDITPPTSEVIAMVQASQGFQYLVSYTDIGFEPSILSIKKNETVRWANNSSHDMWIVDVLSPDTTVCDDSTFNSCKVIKPGEFWEYTFNTEGTIQYMDNMNNTNTGIVNIK